MAIYPAWMWIISLVVIIFLTAIIAVLLVRWQDSHYDEDAPDEERYYRDRHRYVAYNSSILGNMLSYLC